MTLRPFSHWLRRHSNIPLYLVLTVPFVLQTVGATALVGYLSYRTGQQSVENLAQRLMDEVGDRTTLYLENILKVPHLVNQLNADLIRLGQLPGFETQETAPLERYFWAQLLRFPSVSTIAIANERGGMIGSGRSTTTNEIGVYRTQQFTRGTYSVSAVNAQGQVIRTEVYAQNYDARTRPWYQTPQQAGKAVWSPIYQFISREPVLGISAGLPIYGPAGKLQGVLATDITLEQLNQFLSSLEVSPSGQVWIIERSGLFIATSTQSPLFTKTSDTVTRLKAENSQDSSIREVMAQLTQRFGTLTQLQTSQHFNIQQTGLTKFVRVVPFQDQYGLDWLIILVVPEADFTAEIQANNTRTLWLCGLTLLAATALGAFTAHWITQPILKLKQASQALAQGEWQQPLPETIAIAELKTLTACFNQTAEQLHRSFEHIQTALAESTEKFTTIFRTSPDPIALVDWAEGCFLEFNHRLCEFYGYSREELLGQCVVDLGFWVNLEECQRFRARLSQHRSIYNEEVTTRLRSGETRVVLLSGELCNLNGQDVVICILKDISDRRAAEIALEQNEARLKEAQRVAQMGSWELDVPTQKFFWSEELFRIAGLDPTQPEPDQEELLNMIPLEDRATLTEAVRCAIAEGTPYEVEHRIRRPDGTVRYLISKGRAMLNQQQQVFKLYGTTVDITDRKIAELSLKQTLQELTYHIEHSPLATIRWDRDFRIEHWSKQAETMFGWTAAEVLGKTMHDWQLIVEADVEHVNQVANQMLQGVGGICQNRNYHKNGSILYCEWYNSALFDDNGNLVSMLSLVQDVSDRKQAELALQQAKEEAEAANRAKSAFLANMSHELRTPLNVILGYAQLLSFDKNLLPEYQEYLQSIRRSGSHLLTLINDVLDLSKIEAGHLTLDASTFNLPELMQSLWEMFRLRTNAKGLEFTLELAEVPTFITTDLNKLRQVVINLLSNAVKFTESGTITLRVNLAEHISDQRTASKPSLVLWVEVEDTGVGIATEELDTIFEAFSQASAGKRSVEGTGLGLTISQKFVQLMGGSLQATSVVGRGSRFSFWIPVQRVDAAEVQPIVPNCPVLGLLPNQPKYQLLVVDDQVANRQLLTLLLRKVGFEVQEAASGVEAVQLWQTWQPDLISMGQFPAALQRKMQG